MSTNPAKGYYSILQFVPDLEKSEGANIGIVLFCPEKGFLKAQTSTGNDRVRRFFGPESDIELDLDRINAFKATFEERIEIEASRVHTPEEFLQFVNTRANQLLLTNPRPIKVFEPEAELARLFESLVGGRRRARRTVTTTQEELKQQFVHRLTEYGVVGRVQRDFRVESRLLDRTLVFPFAFRNGQMNVIEPISFEGSKKSNIDRACQLAVEGNDLIGRADPVRLNVLGSFDPQQPDTVEHVREVLLKYEVSFHSANGQSSRFDRGDCALTEKGKRVLIISPACLALIEILRRIEEQPYHCVATIIFAADALKKERATAPTETEVLDSVLLWKPRRRPPLDVPIVASTNPESQKRFAP